MNSRPDNPGHPDRADLIVAVIKQYKYESAEATLLRVHGTETEFVMFVSALMELGYQLDVGPSIDCQPKFGCRQVILVIPERIDQVQLAALMRHTAALAETTSEPYLITPQNRD